MATSRRALLRASGGLAAAIALPGCGAPQRGPAVPRGSGNEPVALGLANARFHFRTPAGILALEQEFHDAGQRERAALGLAPSATLPQINLLAVSGGGDDGAFGAGLLNGWTEAGNRPVFNLVTGISTGALTAPFAYLGSAYDPQLRAVYTDVTQRDILSSRWLPTALFSDALADNEPLYRTISRHLNETMLRDIARAYDQGRLLLIFTTDLDGQVPVIWNIGAIAKSGHPRALDTIRRILLASAAVPGAFPPVMFDVEVDGQPYQEMHVDGGAVAQVFLYPADVGEIRRERRRRRLPVPEMRAYIIRNGRFDPSTPPAPRRVLSILGRAVSTMIEWGGYNDVLRTYYQAEQDGVDYNLAFIGRDFPATVHEDFDQAYMRSLYDYGYQRARRGYRWAEVPPFRTHHQPQEHRQLETGIF